MAFTYSIVGLHAAVRHYTLVCMLLQVAKGLLQPIITPEVLQTHPVKKLYETCQKHGLKLQLVDLWSKEGAYEVIVDNNLKGRGKCRAKKEVALNRAANNAYIKVVTKLGLKQ